VRQHHGNAIAQAGPGVNESASFLD